MTRDIEAVQNKIYIYGAKNTFLPIDQDSRTENNSTGWTAVQGSLQHDYSNGWAKVGTYCIKSDAPASKICQFYYTHDPPLTIRWLDTVNFWHLDEGQGSVVNYVRLRAPDSSNYFQADLDTGTNWMFESITLGPGNEYSATLNPNGAWSKTGSPNWWDIEATEFYYERNAENQASRTDGFYYGVDRVTDTAEDGTSQTNYGLREAEFLDDNLLTASDCQKRGEALLYQLKDPVVRIDLVTPGNTNILIGDRLSMTIPAEGISSADYDVVSVSHNFSERGFLTSASMVNSANTRQLPATRLSEVLHGWKTRQGEIGRGIQLVK